MGPFTLTHEVEFPNNWPSKGVDPPTDFKIPDPPLMPQPYALRKLPLTSRFTPTSNLYTGPGKWSQVYRGVFDTPSLRSIDAVLKIYVWDCFPHVQSDEDASYESLPLPYSVPDSYRNTEEIMAWTESWAYGKLSHLQGTIIPQFYGAYLVKTSEESKAHFAVAMSFVNGIPFPQRAAALGGEITGNQQWYPLALALFKGVYELEKSGICALDIRDGNVRVVSSLAGEYPVFFDFAFARPISFEDETLDEIHRVKSGRKTDLSGLRKLIRAVTGYLTPEEEQRAWAFAHWARKNHGDERWMQEWGSNAMQRLEPNDRE
ncbi:hypothetical protein NLJ89_g9684 [Agrocybe chaxingu]|uniref:Uncharacterized protein n=1 Tax=Agrocybe chaxingu TaxID=84603 RepID=A0A9W8MRL1_9AGAR|nr:hypothetical protein NLJ89_g9684 [Agrocybe chaxingu]